MSTVTVSSCLPAAVVATALFTAPAHAEVYRCMIGGVPKFSDQPCHAGDVPVAVPDATVVPARRSEPLADQYDARSEAYQKARAEEDAAWGDEYAARLADEARIRAARQRGEVVAGMSADDVRRMLGEPQKVSVSRSAKAQRETWAYSDGERGRVTVTLVDGVVRDVRSHQVRSRR